MEEFKEFNVPSEDALGCRADRSLPFFRKALEQQSFKEEEELREAREA